MITTLWRFSGYVQLGDPGVEPKHGAVIIYLGIPQEQLGNVAGESDVWTTLLPLPPGPG